LITRRLVIAILGEPGDPAGGWLLTLLQHSGTPRLDLSDQPVKS